MKLRILATTAAALALLTLTHGSVAADESRLGSVSGMIRGPDGKPAVGATVKLVPDGQLKAEGGHEPADEPADDADKPSKKKTKKVGYSATTDAKGRFEFPKVPAASYRISASLTEVGSVRKNLSVTAGNPYKITMQLKRKV